MLTRTLKTPRSKLWIVALLSIGVLAAPTGASGTQVEGTADGWSVEGGPGTIMPTDRTYEGGPALRVDYDFATPYDRSVKG